MMCVSFAENLSMSPSLRGNAKAFTRACKILHGSGPHYLSDLICCPHSWSLPQGRGTSAWKFLPANVLIANFFTSFMSSSGNFFRTPTLTTNLPWTNLSPQPLPLTLALHVLHTGLQFSLLSHSNGYLFS